MRILLVDDELHSREGLRDSLAREGHLVETASDGWQAIQKVKHGRFQVAIVDLDLPQSLGVALTGWDFARIFHAYNSGLSIIMMAVEDWRSQPRQVGELGVVEILEKPISPARLKALLRALDGSPAGPTVPSSRLPIPQQSASLGLSRGVAPS